LAQDSSRTCVAMACFIRTFFSDKALKEKLRMEELESAVLMLTAQLESEKSEKDSLERQLSQMKSETESLEGKSTSLRAAASMKMQRWWSRDRLLPAESFAIYTEDGGSEKSDTASTADETTALDSDTELRKESMSEEAECRPESSNCYAGGHSLVEA